MEHLQFFSSDLLDGRVGTPLLVDHSASGMVRRFGGEGIKLLVQGVMTCGRVPPSDFPERSSVRLPRRCRSLHARYYGPRV